MTFEEAKKQICERKNMYDSIVNRIEDPYNTAKDFYKGEACGLSEAIDILAKVEPVVKDKLTLTELAHELRKLFRFKYLTVSLNKRLHLWSGRAPIYRIAEKYWTSDFIKTSVLGKLLGMELVNVLDLSEYKDEQGNIDYSKCIVEVE